MNTWIWMNRSASAGHGRELKPRGQRGKKRGATAAWLCSLGLLLGACSEKAVDPPPDMSEIRGEPIERMEWDGPQSVGQFRNETAEEGWSESEEDLLMIGFDRLAGFDYVESEGGAEARRTDQIPGDIRALDGREVGVRGFMLPIRMDGGLVREFLLMRDQSMCCFGVIPRINEWVAVTMAGRGVRAMMDQPVTVFGTLRVGEIYEHGVLGGIYQMEGEELAGALDL